MNVRSFFCPRKDHVDVIYNFLLEEHEDVPIEDFCSLYILLVIYKFLLPNRNKTVILILFCDDGMQVQHEDDDTHVEDEVDIHQSNMYVHIKVGPQK